MNSPVVERNQVVGRQAPTVLRMPPNVVSHDAAQGAIELADAYDIGLGDAQRTALDVGMAETETGWAARTFAECKPRQQGKNNEVETRELYGLVVLGEMLQLHTAHEFPTANEAFGRMEATLMNHDDLRKKVDRPRYANDEKGFDFLNGARLRYRTRTKGAGRGFAEADLVVYDEAQSILDVHMGSLGPTGLANPNSQSWFAGTGGFSWSKFWWRLRRRALEPVNGSRFGYIEHSAQIVTLDVDGRILLENPPDMMDVEAWARAMPRLNDGLVTFETVEELYGMLGPDLFGLEALCLWEPEPTAENDGPISITGWDALERNEATPDNSDVRLSFQVSPDREWATFTLAGTTVDGFVYVEIRDSRPHDKWDGWVIERGKELAVGHKTPIILLEGSQGATFQQDFEKAKVRVDVMKRGEFASGWVRFVDAVTSTSPTIRHRGQTALRKAVDMARTRKAGDDEVEVLSSKSSGTDVSPLMGVVAAFTRLSAPSSPSAPTPFVVYG